MIEIRCRSWIPGIKAVSLIQLVSRSNGVPLKCASDLVEKFFEGGDLVVLTENNEAQLKQELFDLGVRFEE